MADRPNPPQKPQQPEWLPPPTRGEKAYDGLIKFNQTVAWLKGWVAVWFLRLCWFPALGWGLYDLYMLQTAGETGKALKDRESNVAIRISVGVILCVVWFFMARRWGRWTINRGGALETPPWKKTAEG